MPLVRVANTKSPNDLRRVSSALRCPNFGRPPSEVRLSTFIVRLCDVQSAAVRRSKFGSATFKVRQCDFQSSAVRRSKLGCATFKVRQCDVRSSAVRLSKFGSAIFKVRLCDVQSSAVRHSKFASAAFIARLCDVQSSAGQRQKLGSTYLRRQNLVGRRSDFGRGTSEAGSAAVNQAGAIPLCPCDERLTSIVGAGRIG